MQVRLLGPVDVAVEGQSRPVNGLRRKAVLATLALHDGQVVSTDRLVDVVWGRSAPLTVVNSLQTHISYLRGVLGNRDAIVAQAPGYRLNLGCDGTDARAAERLVLVSRGVDEKSLVVPEAGHLALRAAYESNLRGYRDGGSAGVHAWLLYAAEAFAAGAEASPLRRPAGDA